MRVLFLRNDDINPDVRVEKEARSLLKDGHRVMAFACDRTGGDMLYEERVYPEGTFYIERKRIVYGYGGGFKRNIIPLIKFQLAIIYYLIKNRKSIDIIHACDFNTAFTTRVVSKIIRRPYVYDIFDYYVDSYAVPEKLKSLINKLDHKTIKKAAATIICSEERIEQINLGKDWPYVILHNAPNYTSLDINRKPIASSDKFKISYVGGLAKKRKLDSFAELISRNPRIELHVAGYGELDKYFELASNTMPNVFFYGKVDYQSALAIEAQCDAIAALYPTDTRNHLYAAPNKVYEALMLGKPLLMIRGSGMSKMVEENGFGILVEFDEKDITRGIEELKMICHGDVSPRMKKMFSEKYSWKIMEERLIKLYRDLEG